MKFDFRLCEFRGAWQEVTWLQVTGPELKLQIQDVTTLCPHTPPNDHTDLNKTSNECLEKDLTNKKSKR